MNGALELERGHSSFHSELDRPQEGIGARLRQVRGELSQAEFAARLGAGKSSVDRYEKDTRYADSQFLAAVCEQFSIAPAWLLLGRGPMRPGEAESPAGPLDLDTLTGAIETVEEALASTRRVMAPDKKAALVAAVYDLFMSGQPGQVDKGVVLRLVKSAS